jgi:hypothetical protein
VSYQINHDENRYVRIRYRTNGMVEVTVGRAYYVIDALWNAGYPDIKKGQTTATFILKDREA